MKYRVYKMKFNTAVHFGNGMLNESDFIFKSDSLFSALYIESIKLNCHEQFYKCIEEGCVSFSDLLPYIEDRYYIPKPNLYIDTNNLNKGDSIEKKKIKKIKYIPVDKIDSFLSGVYESDEEKFGEKITMSKAYVRTKEDTEPYHVGTFKFYDNAGLYIILAYKNEKDLEIIEKLLESLSYTGIGGKKSQGLGKYTLLNSKDTETLIHRLDLNDKKVYMTLSTCMAREDELAKSLDGASYSLIKRSGFVDSLNFSEEPLRKKDFFMFNSGACFVNKFEGGIFNLSPFNGKHPVYRYARPLFIGVK